VLSEATATCWLAAMALQGVSKEAFGLAVGIIIVGAAVSYEWRPRPPVSRQPCVSRLPPSPACPVHRRHRRQRIFPRLLTLS
jgi:hypothetical protein